LPEQHPVEVAMQWRLQRSLCSLSLATAVMPAAALAIAAVTSRPGCQQARSQATG
jgi:hypothetical protein